MNEDLQHLLNVLVNLDLSADQWIEATTYFEQWSASPPPPPQPIQPPVQLPNFDLDKLESKMTSFENEMKTAINEIYKIMMTFQDDDAEISVEPPAIIERATIDKMTIDKKIDVLIKNSFHKGRIQIVDIISDLSKTIPLDGPSYEYAADQTEHCLKAIANKWKDIFNYQQTRGLFPQKHNNDASLPSVKQIRKARLERQKK